MVNKPGLSKAGSLSPGRLKLMATLRLSNTLSSRALIQLLSVGYVDDRVSAVEMARFGKNPELAGCLEDIIRRRS